MKKLSVRKRLLASLLSLSLLALAAPVLAENRPGAVTISPYVGGYVFDHEQVYQNLESSPIFGLRAGYNFTENWGAEARFGYVYADSRAANYSDADVYSYGIDALYHFNVTPNFVPFLAAGIGGMHHEFRDNDQGYYPEYAANYGVGVKYFVSDAVALRGDVRHVILPDDELNNLEYTVGVTFQIGGEKPAVVAAATPVPEPCPVPAPVPAPVLDTTAPTVSLTAPVQGATDADVDMHVSVAFSEPMDPSTINSQTFTLKKGDTLLAGKVKNPSVTSASFTEAENLELGTKYTGTITTGAKDLAGNSLASDYVWSFTTAPEQKVVTKVETKVVVVNNFVMLGSSHFEFDQAALTPAGKEMLKQNVKIMKDNPALRVRIAGHASASGSDEYNQVLSERRAESAKIFLVEEGVAPERIEIIGYGETRPAQVESNPADLGSAAAQANMRVVFEVIEK